MIFERQNQLYDILKEKGSATVAELARMLYTSEASVRRDISALEKSGLVSRVYGGVVLASYKNSELPLSLRDAENSKIKEEIARRAAAYIEDGMTVIIDSSSTARRIVKYISHLKGLRIITNNLSIFEEGRRLDFEIYCTGGYYSRKGNDLLGPSAESFISSVTADILFFSAEGIDKSGEITDVSEERNSLRRVMMARARKRYFLCDDSKIGVRRTFTLCSAAELDGVICNAPLPWEEKP